MKKFTLLFAIVLFIFNSGFSQLSTRENDDTKVKLGARPVGGNMALTFAYDIYRGKDDRVADLYGGNLLQNGDLLTFKYYLSKKTAIRIGINLSQKNIHTGGTIADTVSGIIPFNTTKELNVRQTAREYILVPGIEHHFLESNIFDVYYGADLLIGFGRKLYEKNEDLKNGDYYHKKMTDGTFVAGLGGVVGFNVFIAQLPISLGLEYGLNLKWEFGNNKAKVKEENKVGGTTTTADYQVPYSWPEKVSDYPGPGPGPETDIIYYEKYKNNSFGMATNQNVRIILNIYFGK